ncbi:MAG: hypothetical protein ACM37W_05045 [Actinomycetota bacterium]
MQKKSIEAIGLAAGLLWFIVFTVGFLLLGHSLNSSIILGILGSVAGGWVVAWWHNDEKPSPPVHQAVTPTKPILPELVKTKLQSKKTQTNWSHRSVNRGITLFDWLFRPNRR